MDTVRSVVQPLTHSLPIQVHDFGGTIIGDACYKALVLDVDLSNTECLKLAVSKGLGIGIIAASSIVKVPQIIKLVRSKSASGVSFLSYLLETSSYLISLAYNIRNGFPFSTFGETALILGQNVIITVLVLNYAGRASAAAVFVAVLAASVVTLFSEKILPMDTLRYLQGGAGVLGVASKVPQILAIWQQGGTGQLSAFTVFNYLAGSLSRIYTTLQEVDDKLILYGFIAGFALNAVLAAQMVYYWNVPSAKAKGKQRAQLEATPLVPGAPVLAPAQPSAFPSTGAATGATPTKGRGPTTRRRG
ncbi:mannose-P-dolichol utilization defect 1 protein [Coniochaeta ligniaria NRRL 30616]|uniref:Mannose-P-dolichol utilization defect 1 protein n=1 Tax=Coniochaeta ligniaria NRRL 30616 TaxID=1408157 RepID=A0A1J7J9R1_9PEZI|nr:mannose-P-dolichol utilization defect 1 protein [Coniochaeta ligniaria NRRL 30616]